MIKTILFDLDGTLLPMDQDAFTKGYFKLLAGKLAPLGYEPQKLVKVIWNGTTQMIMNQGKKSNEEVFWDAFQKEYGEESLKDKDSINAFYENEFEQAKVFCPSRENLQEVIDTLKQMGYQLVVATNPVFPTSAMEARIRWAGLNVDDFAYVTSYSNSSYCKPNPDYYVEILEKLGLTADECLMVGNNVEEDMVASQIGMDVFLMPEYLINEKELPMDHYPQGDFQELLKYLKERRSA